MRTKNRIKQNVKKLNDTIKNTKLKVIMIEIEVKNDRNVKGQTFEQSVTPRIKTRCVVCIGCWRVWLEFLLMPEKNIGF